MYLWCHKSCVYDTEEDVVFHECYFTFVSDWCRMPLVKSMSPSIQILKLSGVSLSMKNKRRIFISEIGDFYFFYRDFFSFDKNPYIKIPALCWLSLAKECQWDIKW
jgi:hypothetical protein